MTAYPLSKSLLTLAMIGLPLTAATPAAAAEPVTLVCKGSRTAPNNSTGAVTTRDVSFQIRIDDQARALTRDGHAMVIRDWSPRRIVYSDYNPGLLGAMAGGVVTTLDRTTGAWRDKWGSGTCKGVERKK